jgi:hypothetical protein
VTVGRLMRAERVPRARARYYCYCPEPGARPPEGEPGYRECWYEKRALQVMAASPPEGV